MTDDLHFTTKDNKVWTRITYGFEGVAACMSNDANGMNHFYISTSVSFAEPVTADALTQPVTKAWTRLRHWAPVVGTRTIAHPSDKNVYLITYVPPASAAEATQWAGETVKWDQGVKSLYERDDAIKNVWWKPSDNHWAVELHVGPAGDGLWSFILAAGHWSSDARGTIPLVDKFLELLLAELKGTATPIEGLSWGTETAKLPPAATQTLKLSDAATGAATEKVESNLGAGIPPPDAPPPPPMFGRPPALIAGSGDNAGPETKSLAGRIVLTAEETALLAKESKAHGATVTETMNTILVLSEIETILRTAARDETKFAEVKEKFEGAAIYPLALTTFSRRNFLAPEYANHDAPKGCPSFAFEGFPIIHSMANIRKCLSISSNSVSISATPEAFWGGAVADTILEIEKLKKSGTPEGYVASQTATNALVPIFDPVMFSAPAMVTTSTGSLTKLKMLERWEPRAQGPLTIKQIILSLRSTSGFPYNTVTFWEWDGQININMNTASDYLGTIDLQMLEESVKKWIKFIGGQ